MVKARVGAFWKRTRATDLWLVDYSILIAIYMIYVVYFRVFFHFGICLPRWEWSYVNHLVYGAGLSLHDLWRSLWWLGTAFFLLAAAGHVLVPRKARPAGGGVTRIVLGLTCLSLALISGLYLSTVPYTHSKSEMREHVDEWLVEGRSGTLGLFRLAVERDLPGAETLCEALLTDPVPSRRLYAAVVRYDLGFRDEAVRDVILTSMSEICGGLDSADSTLSRADLSRVAQSLMALRDGRIRGASLQRELGLDSETLLDYLRVSFLPWWKENAHRFE